MHCIQKGGSGECNIQNEAKKNEYIAAIYIATIYIHAWCKLVTTWKLNYSRLVRFGCICARGNHIARQCGAVGNFFIEVFDSFVHVLVNQILSHDCANIFLLRKSEDGARARHLALHSKCWAFWTTDLLINLHFLGRVINNFPWSTWCIILSLIMSGHYFDNESLRGDIIRRAIFRATAQLNRELTGLSETTAE